MQRFSLHLADPSRTLRVSRFRGREGASKCYRFDAFVDLAAAHDPLDPVGLIGKQAVLDFGRFDEPRCIAGVVLAVSDERAGVLRVRIGPRIETLRHRKQNRVFQGLSVPEIVDQVLDDAGRLPRKWRIKGGHPARNYAVRYRESDLAFVLRLLAEEGIFFFFEHEAGKQGETIVFADDVSAYAPIGERANLRYATRDDDGGLTGNEVRDLSVERRTATTGAKLSAYDPERPLLELAASAKTDEHPAVEPATWLVDEHGEVPQTRVGRGGSAPEVTAGRAQALLEQHRRGAWRAKGTSASALLRPGGTFTLTGREETLGAPKDGHPSYVCSEVEHEGRDLMGLPEAAGPAYITYENRFVCAPASVPIRPAPAPRRALHVTETAIVVGPPGQDIHTDSYGRVKVQFFWDRDGKRNEKSSCWLRVVQGWAGPGMGTQIIPRVGMEVLVVFLQGDPDQPVVVGALPNIVTPPPFDPSKEPTRSGIRTRSVPGSPQGAEERYQELSFDDKRGAESVTLRAQRELSVFGVDLIRPESWASRIDGGIGPFGLYFILHKVPVSGSGMVIHLSASGWFTGRSWDENDKAYQRRFQR